MILVSPINAFRSRNRFQVLSLGPKMIDKKKAGVKPAFKLDRFRLISGLLNCLDDFRLVGFSYNSEDL